jgi:hypothetical protein
VTSFFMRKLIKENLLFVLLAVIRFALIFAEIVVVVSTINLVCMD